LKHSGWFFPLVPVSRGYHGHFKKKEICLFLYALKALSLRLYQSLGQCLALPHMSTFSKISRDTCCVSKGKTKKKIRRDFTALLKPKAAQAFTLQCKVTYPL
jgi:hypothetical protein